MIVLDFDGVLYDSAYEAFQVCQKVANDSLGCRKDVDYSEFMKFRRHLTDAWQYNRLYSIDLSIKNYSLLDQVSATSNDKAFADSFFNARKEMMLHEDWAKIMLPYKFFTEIKGYLSSHSGFFKILSTRNEESISRTLKFNGVTNIEIAGQEHIKEMGSKANVFKSLGWGESHDNFSIYIDDMPRHLASLSGLVDLVVHADWGYGDLTNKSSSQEFCADLVKACCKRYL